MNNRHAILFGFSALLLVGGCSQEGEVTDNDTNPFGDEFVATVDGHPIYTSIFERYTTARLQKTAIDLSDEERDLIINELIQFNLMAAAAVESGIDQEQNVAVDLEIQRLQALSRVMASRYLEENPVTDAALRAAYDENLSRMSGPQYKARHILLEQESEATTIIEELDQGADFATLARLRSTGPSGPNGGDLGWFSPDTMVPPFANAVTAMEVGTYSEEPVQTRFGWHVILLEDVQQQQAPAMEAVRAEMTSFVEQRQIEQYLNSLEDAAVIEIGDSAPTR